jgi:hypothetical protein
MLLVGSRCEFLARLTELHDPECRRPSTLVEGSVESPDTLCWDRSYPTQRFSVFNQLTRSRLELALADAMHYSLPWKEIRGAGHGD